MSGSISVSNYLEVLWLFFATLVCSLPDIDIPEKNVSAGVEWSVSQSGQLSDTAYCRGVSTPAAYRALKGVRRRLVPTDVASSGSMCLEVVS